ncbi:D-alanyl-D-alanine carboxypeptidase/D-alanyl-D-alanine endopeptidase [Paracoccus methylarcula]|uniref:D-alanyl-D-alanine carboxypeptidase/D-alanyl-D-alanine endopeptidase n=1 Tax=Paracoccus methylarcula TaxID=72022 RepID=UPI001FE4C20D|nr:D-alanyl-D-alanine carboxypeptidase/D-alanyl-D-alanine-endopeptidase [Paracoccus methylarcula]
MSLISRRAVLTAALAAGLTGRQALARDMALGLAQRPPVKPVPGSASLIARADLSGQVCYAVFDPSAGAMLEDGAGSASLAPASTLKMVTALYALDRLGPSHRFRTRILRAGDMLVLAGAGDPVLSSDDLADLAAKLVDTGQGSPKRFAIWGGALPRIEEIAPPQADHLAYNPALSGMILNFNRVHLGWRRGGDSYEVSLEARAARNSPRAYTITAHPAAQQDLFGYRFDDGREVWTVSRSAMGRAGSRWLPVRQPELYAGDVFQTLCRAKGLVLPAPEVIDSLPAAEELVSHESPPLSRVVEEMLYYSTNLTAEVIGLHASGAPDLTASAAKMREWVAAQGLSDDFSFADHSGLSAESRVSAVAMVRLLAGPGLEAGLPDLLKHNPLAGVADDDTPHRAEVFAKTGTLNFVSNLAGYAIAPSGRRLAFATLCSDGPRHAATRGQEMPAGVSSWTRRAKRLQHELIESWVARFG